MVNTLNFDELKILTTRTCKNCGISFSIFGGRLYCSDLCRGEVLHLQKIEQNQRRWMRYKENKTVPLKFVNCVNCSKQFLQKTNTQKFCSNVCRVNNYSLQNILKSTIKGN